MRKLLERPFRLGTTSFIYADHIIPNVKKTGALFDEIELLVFESRPRDVLPSRADICELARLARELNLTYNVHLPVDVNLTDPSPIKQADSAQTLFQVMELFAPLNPTTHTLHLEMDRNITTPEDLQEWTNRAGQGLKLFVPRLPDPRALSLETLWYPSCALKNLVERFDLSLTMDVGHHFVHGHNLNVTSDLYQGRIPLVHAHGVDFSEPTPRDHKGLDRLPKEMFEALVLFLSTYGGTLSLEVFNRQALTRSLERLGSVFRDIPNLSL